MSYFQHNEISNLYINNIFIMTTIYSFYINKFIT